jgi:hypothetical protein
VTIDRRLIFRYCLNWKVIVATAVIWAFATFAVVVRVAYDPHFSTRVKLLALALIAVVVTGTLVVSITFPPGVRVRESDQPELFALVHDVAARAGFRPPNRVWLTNESSVKAAARLGRRELLMGWPLLVCLTEPELRSLIAHELALLQLPRARSAISLVRQWSKAVADIESETNGSRVRTLEADLRSIGQTASAVGDAAAISAAGSAAVAVRALVVSDLANGHYWSFVRDTAAPRPRWRWLWDAPRVIEDIDDGWRRTLVHSWNDWLNELDEDDLVAAAVAAHPTLAAAFGGAAGGLGVIGPPPASPMPAPSPRLRRRLVRRRATSFARWYTFASAPPRWWVDRAWAEAEDTRRDVTAVLGRRPVDDLEAIDVYLNRGDEVLDQTWKRLAVKLNAPELGIEDEADEGEDPPPETWEPGPVFCALAEHALLVRGWRLEHPALRGILIGPYGQRLDVRTTVTPDPPGWNLDGLRAVLRPVEVDGRSMA